MINRYTATEAASAHVEGAGEAVLGAQHEGPHQAEQDEDDDAGADGADEPRCDNRGDTCSGMTAHESSAPGTRDRLSTLASNKLPLFAEQAGRPQVTDGEDITSAVPPRMKTRGGSGSSMCYGRQGGNREHALEVGELGLARVPQNGGASAEYQGHAHHTTNCGNTGASGSG